MKPRHQETVLWTFFLVLVGGWISLSESTSFVDRVCKLAADPGKPCADPKVPGQGPENLYNFDLSKEKCVRLSYLGCGGNQNRFENSEDCIDSCQTPYFIKKNKEEDKKHPPGSEPHKKSDCNLPPVQGPCKALITMWYYNPTNSACQQFGYGGCDQPGVGNSNHFDTRLDCETFCGDVSDPDPITKT